MRYRCGAKIAKDLSLFLGAALSFGFVGHVSATDMGLSINVFNTNSLSIVLGGEGSNGSVAVDITPHDAVGTFNESGDVTATVITTNRNGYTLNMTRSSAGMSSDDTNNTATIDELSSSEDGYTSATFPANKWGYSLKTDETFGNYFGIGDGVELQNSNESTNGSTSTLKLGAKVNLEMPAGSYSTTINFVAVGKVESRTYIQDVTSLNCPTNPTIVYDSRDEAAYTIQKLADGKCWLLDNLALDLTDPDVQANLTSATTNASNTTLGYLKGITTRNPSTDPDGNYATAGVANWTSGYSASEPLINMTSKNNIAEDGANGYTTGRYGIYYNYCAASAGSYCYYNDDADYWAALSTPDNIMEDICPKGWRIPTGDYYSGEYQVLYSAYGEDEYNYVSSFRLPLSGYFEDGSVYSLNGIGFFWSSTKYVNSAIHNLYIEKDIYTDNNLIVEPSWTNYVGRGYSVRCVAKTASLQSVTASTCPTTPTTVVDSRDGEEYTIQKLADGSCWLLDNLRLDLTDQDVQAVLSSDNTNASDTTISYLLNGGGTSSDRYAISSITNWTNNSTSFSTPLINVAYKNSTGTGGYEIGKYGVYYNYCAASAGGYCYGSNSGVNDATEDVCPKGWCMPTGGVSNSDYESLYSAYLSNYNNFIDAFHVSLAGYYNASAYGQGSTIFLWSSKKSTSGTMAGIEVTTSGVTISASGSRDIGRSMRCILK